MGNKLQKHWVMDYETNINCFLAVFEHYKTDETHVFTVGQLRNDLKKLLAFFEQNVNNNEWHISFNGLAFDAQITQFIIVNRYKLLKMTGEDAARAIYDEAQEVIGRSYRREFQKYSEKKMAIKQIDIFKLNHWDNPAKSSSLKWIQCSMDWHNVQDMPIEHTEEINTVEQLKDIASYCRNDVSSTKHIMSEHSAKQIELRGQLTNAYGIRLYSASEMRISKELFMYFLSQKTGVSTYEYRKMRTFRNFIRVNDILLDYINFDGVPEFQELLRNFRKLVINPNETKGGFKYSVKYRGVKTDFGLGGIHGAKRGIYESDEVMTIMSSDVTSYYPNLAIRNGWSPAHLPSNEFCELYEWFFEERKKIPKSDIRNKVYKLILNGTYGLSNDKHSFLYDPEFTMKITINGQLSLAMLHVMLTENIPGSIPIMQNTDGLEMMIPRKYKDKYLEICEQWEKMTQLQLEHDQYQKLIVPDVNNYIGVFNYKEVSKEDFYKLQKENPDNPFKKENGKYYMAKTKCKGRFEFLDRPLHKNKSFTVVPKALFYFFVHGVKPEDYLPTNQNIFDYCGQVKAKGQWKFVNYQVGEGIPEQYRNYTVEQKREYLEKNGWQKSWSDDNWVKSDVKNKEANNGIPTDVAFEYSVKSSGQVLQDHLQKTLRYYVSVKGSKIVKHNTNDKRDIKVESGPWLQTVFNLYDEKSFEEYGINSKFYLDKINKEIKGMMPEIFSNQMSLF